MNSSRPVLLLSSCLLLISAAPSQAATNPYVPLALYQGTWRELPSGRKPFQLANVCGRIGDYFACQQAVHGDAAVLLVFIPAKEAGHYYTQSVLPNGWAGARGELQIQGSYWVFQSKAQTGNRSVYYRTINRFSGENRIRYEIYQSTDHQHWKRTGGGDEIRLSSTAAIPGS